MIPINLELGPLRLDEKYLCLDFSNTLNWRKGEAPEEQFHTYADLAGWAESIGLLPSLDAKALIDQAAERPAEAEAVFQRAIELREVIYNIFSASAHGQLIPAADLDVLNGAIAEAMSRARLAVSDSRFSWQWSDNPRAFDRLLWPIARSAAELLTSNDLNRVGECASEKGCAWLFYDTTRNHSRRWCSMDSCGNRAKAKRHYTRQKD